MITSNALQRTFQICLGNTTGTAFFVDIDDRQYLVTAKHLVEELKGEAIIGIKHNEQWKPLTVRVVGHADAEVDISVLTIDRRIPDKALKLEPSSKDLLLGQDVYFLGFPYGLSGSMPEDNNGYPVPFVKKASVSCFDLGGGAIGRMYLDGINNVGFSGGPVVFQHYGAGELKVAGIISAYRYEPQPVYHGLTPIENVNAHHNTGLIITYAIEKAVEIARANPIGAL